jgi:uncharacterized protein (DUF433 family)
MVADGMTEEEILKAYPDLEREDIREARRFAAEAVADRAIQNSLDALLTEGRFRTIYR